MNAQLVEQNDENFAGEAVMPAKLVESGDPKSRSWLFEELDSPSKVRTGIWEGDPGVMLVGSYPVREYFTVMSGCIEITNDGGEKFRVMPGQSCLLPKGWKGKFGIVEKTQKMFVTSA